MALLTKNEFAEQCGIQTKALSVYIQRGKVVVVNEHLDTNNDRNKAFIEKNKGKKREKELIKDIPTIAPTVKHQVNIDDFDDDVLNEDDEDSEVPALYVSEKLLKHLDTKKREREISLLKIKEDKIRGIVIPSDLIKPVFLQHNQYILMEQKNADEEILTMYAHKYSMSLEDIAFMRGEYVKRRNAAVQKAAESSAKAVENIVRDFSDKRGVGERV